MAKTYVFEELKNPGGFDGFRKRQCPFKRLCRRCFMKTHTGKSEKTHYIPLSNLYVYPSVSQSCAVKLRFTFLNKDCLWLCKHTFSLFHHLSKQTHLLNPLVWFLVSDLSRVNRITLT